MPDSKVTLADLAEIAGVSTSTVSRALSDSPQISYEVKEQIREIARNHNYRIHRGARNLRLQKTGMVAAILPIDADDTETLSNPFVLQFIGAVGLELRRFETNLVLLQEHSISGQLWHSGIADGFIQLGHGVDPSKLNDLPSDMPLVVWGQQLPDQKYVTVGVDNRALGQQAVEHLIEQGRQRIGIIAGDFGKQDTESYYRFRGYQDALQSAGIPYDENLLSITEYDSASGRRAAERLIQQAPDIDALFVAHSDLLAMIAIEYLRHAGRDVPGDVAVIGFDNMGLGEHLAVPLSTVSQEVREQGAAVLVDTLMQLIKGEKVTSVITPGKIIVRASSRIR